MDNGHFNMDNGNERIDENAAASEENEEAPTGAENAIQSQETNEVGTETIGKISSTEERGKARQDVEDVIRSPKTNELSNEGDEDSAGTEENKEACRGVDDDVQSLEGNGVGGKDVAQGEVAKGDIIFDSSNRNRGSDIKGDIIFERNSSNHGGSAPLESALKDEGGNTRATTQPGAVAMEGSGPVKTDLDAGGRAFEESKEEIMPDDSRPSSSDRAVEQRQGRPGAVRVDGPLSAFQSDLMRYGTVEESAAARAGPQESEAQDSAGPQESSAPSALDEEEGLDGAVHATLVEEPLSVTAIQVVEPEEHDTIACENSDAPDEDKDRAGMQARVSRGVLVAALGFIAILAAAIAIPVALTRDNESEGGKSSSGADTYYVPSMMPSTTFSLAPSCSPTTSTYRYDSILEVVSSVSAHEDLQNTTSPQYKALDWIVHEDEAKIAGTEAERIIQRYVVALLYFSTGGDEGLWAQSYGFLSNVHECEWTDGLYGVKSCNTDNVVTTLDFSATGLVGTIPSEVGALAKLLQFRILNEEGVTGTIPTEMGLLTEMTFLSLVGNSLTGSMPSQLSNLHDLTGLWLHRNSLTGTIPPLFGGSFPNMIWMWLHENQLTGEVPQSFVNMTSATHLWFYGNGLTGSVDFLCDTLYNKTLDELSVDRDEVQCGCCACCGSSFMMPTSSPAPSSLPTTSTYRYDSMLEVVSSVSAHEDLQNTTSSQYKALDWIVRDDEAKIAVTEAERIIQRYVVALLYFSTGGDEGLWAQSYGFLGNVHECEWTDGLYGVKSCNTDDVVTTLDFSVTGLVGTIPSEVGALTKLLQFRILNEEGVTGTIPTEMGLLTEMTFLSLVGNSLTGSIPSQLSNLHDLSGLWLHRNSLTGTIPPSFGGSFPKLLWLWLHENQLTGEVPQSFVNMTSATHLWFYGNGLTGSVDFLCDNLYNDTLVELKVDREEVQCGCCACCG